MMIDRRDRFSVGLPASCIALAVALSSCGGAPRKEPQKPAAAPPAIVAVSREPDLSPAAEPTHLVGIARWRSPAASLAQVGNWTGFPIKAAALLRELGDEAARAIDADAPVDAVLALDPRAADFDAQVFAAVSFGLRSFEDGKRLAEAYGPLTEIWPGGYRIGGKDVAEGDKDTPCVLAAAVGRAPARVVCGASDRDVEALAPYLLRTLPLRDLGPADLHLELRFGPAQQLYGPMLGQVLRMAAVMAPQRLGTGEPNLDRAIGRAAVALTQELAAVAADLDTAKLDVTLAPEDAKVSWQMHLGDRQSWTAGTLRSVEKNAASAPEEFWHLPGSSAFAMFAFPSDPRRYTEIVRTLGELVDGWLQHEGIPAADRAAATAIFSPQYLNEAALVGASGPFAEAPLPKGENRAQAVKTPFGAGWRLWSEAESEKTPEAIKRLALLFNRPKMKELLQSKLGTKDVFGIKLVAAPPQLPKGTLDYEVSFPAVPGAAEAAPAAGKGGKRARPVKAAARPTAHALVMIDAGHTWLALGADRSALAELLQKVKQGGAGAATLATRDGLEPLRKGRFTSGGFFSFEMLADGWMDGALAGRARGAASVIRDLLRGVPHQGKTPIVFGSHLTTGASDATWTAELSVPKAAIEDASVLAAGAMSGMLTPRHRP